MSDAMEVPRDTLPSSSDAPKRGETLRRTVGEFLRLAIIAAAVALPIRYFVAQPFVVDGASMEPNFHDGQYLVIDELSYFLREPSRGEVIVFRYPGNPKIHYIKRVIGLPGETVEIKDGAVFIFNSEHSEGFRLDESYLPEDIRMSGNFRFTLRDGEYVVLGDNRSESADSRFWGVLERKFMTGRAIFRAWPPDAFGPIPNAS